MSTSVSVFIRPYPDETVQQANDAIRDMAANNFEASRIEFCKSPGDFIITIKWRKHSPPKPRVIYVTLDPEAWGGIAALNHPVIYYAGTLWYCSIDDH